MIDLKEQSDYLTSVFTEDCRYMLTAWEYRSNEEEKPNVEFFWMNKFPNYLNQIRKNASKLVLLEDNYHE